MAAAGNNGDSGNPLEFPAAADRRSRGAGAASGCRWAPRSPTASAAAFSTHNDYVSLAAPGASAGDCDFGVFSTLPATTITCRGTTRGRLRRASSASAGARYAYGEGTSFAAPIVSGLAALAWQAEPRLASEQVAEVLIALGRPARGWNQFTGAGVVDGMHAVEIARIYDVIAPEAQGQRARRHGNR